MERREIVPCQHMKKGSGDLGPGTTSSVSGAPARHLDLEVRAARDVQPFWSGGRRGALLRGNLVTRIGGFVSELAACMLVHAVNYVAAIGGSGPLDFIRGLLGGGGCQNPRVLSVLLSLTRPYTAPTWPHTVRPNPNRV
jgi:hypothetical protein